jgi:hypothetical protein
VAASEAPAAPTAAASPGRYYRVVTPFSGDRSLEQAQQAVDDAYVHNAEDGAQIRYGAFSDEARAEELRQQLEQQGIPAEIEEP